MAKLTTAFALRAAINVLRDSAESPMPSGEPLDEASVQLQFTPTEPKTRTLPAVPRRVSAVYLCCFCM
ncbi:hypothetical protein C9I56_37215 [Paraburkholderia caribensis]|nr:hypothetical protein C9I56_37215 [Paraburkholderia caribensis]